VLDVPYRHWEPEIAASLDSVVVVMSPCVPHAHRTGRILQDVAVDRVAVVTNRLGRGGETARGQIESILGRKIAVELPTFPGLRDAEGRQQLAPLTWSRWGRTLARLARALESS
jgi:CO dehydrogenase nickel-insertion accessory protein CooC1